MGTYAIWIIGTVTGTENLNGNAIMIYHTPSLRRLLAAALFLALSRVRHEPPGGGRAGGGGIGARGGALVPSRVRASTISATSLVTPYMKDLD